MAYLKCNHEIQWRVLASSHHTTHRRVECVWNRCVQTWDLSSKSRWMQSRWMHSVESILKICALGCKQHGRTPLHIFFEAMIIICDHLRSSMIQYIRSLPDKVDALQVKLLRRMLQKQGVRTGLHGVEVNSVDGFQGREKEARHRPIHFVAGHKDFTCRIFVQPTLASSIKVGSWRDTPMERDHVAWCVWANLIQLETILSSLPSALVLPTTVATAELRNPFLQVMMISTVRVWLYWSW